MKRTWKIIIAALAAAVLFLASGSMLYAFEFDGRNICVRGTKIEPCMRERPYSDIGIASVYRYSAKPTASGDVFDPRKLTAAHRWLPFGTRVRVTNLRNGKSVVVKINDRGPLVRGRIIDITPAGAAAIGFSGLVKTKVEEIR